MENVNVIKDIMDINVFMKFVDIKEIVMVMVNV
jgi:hypothetical protein